jgi:hypothetical protein
VSERRPRWDTDTRRIGVADGRAWRPTIATLSELVEEDGWVAEEPDVHLLPHLAAAASATGRLRISGATTQPSGEFVVDLEWIGDPAADRRDRRIALYTLVGTIAETVTVTREPAMSAGRELEMLTGGPLGESPFGGHGHTVRLRLVEMPDDQSEG